jgi:uncharacterized membrane protein
MWLLILGVLAFAVLHLIKGVSPATRDSIAAKLGDNAFKGIFSLALVLSIVAMVFGWQATSPGVVYVPPAWTHPVTSVLVLIAFIFFAASHGKSNIKRFVRHPMLTGVVIWAVGHLLMNGDDRSIVLFGGLGLWAILEIIVIGKRDGPAAPAKAVALKREVIPVIAGIVVFVVFVLLHPILFGVSPLPK